MIITEIKKLNVRISVFEDPVFDENILPVFTTPLILKEVAARKKSKYKIETLNPEKKLTFRIVSFNEIIAKLSARINKIAIKLEPHYYIDPSYPNSLPYKVKQNLDIKNKIDETKEIEEALLRVTSSTVRGKILILYAGYYKQYLLRNRHNRYNIWNRRKNRNRSPFKIAPWNYQILQLNQNKSDLAAKRWYRQKIKEQGAAQAYAPGIHLPLFTNNKNNADNFQYRDGAVKNFKKIICLLRDLNIMTRPEAYNKKNKSLTTNHKIDTVTPLSGAKLGLLTTKNVLQSTGNPKTKISLTIFAGYSQSEGTTSTTAYTNPKDSTVLRNTSAMTHTNPKGPTEQHSAAFSIQKKNRFPSLQSANGQKEKNIAKNQTVPAAPYGRHDEEQEQTVEAVKIKNNKQLTQRGGEAIEASKATLTLPLRKNLIESGWIPTSKGALMILADEGWDLDLLLNKNKTGAAAQRLKEIRPYKLRKLRRLRRLRRLRLMSINLYLHRSKNIERIQKDQECQGRNNSKLNNVGITRPVKSYKSSNNKYLIKHNSNKLNFIVNWIGNNLSNNQPSLAESGLAPINQRLNKNNIPEIYLVQQSQPIQLFLLEEKAEPLKETLKPENNKLSGVQATLLHNNSSSSRYQPKAGTGRAVTSNKTLQRPIPHGQQQGCVAASKHKKSKASRTLFSSDLAPQLESQAGIDEWVSFFFPKKSDKAAKNKGASQYIADKKKSNVTKKENQNNIKANVAKKSNLTSFANITHKANKGGDTRTQNRKFSTFATSFTTTSSIANLNLLLKVKIQVREASSAASNDQDSSLSNKLTKAQLALLKATNSTSAESQTNAPLPAAQSTNNKSSATTVQQAGNAVKATIGEEKKMQKKGQEKKVKRKEQAKFLIPLNTAKPVKPQELSNTLYLKLKQADTREKIMDKKKTLSANLLNKTNLSYVKSLMRRRNLFIGNNFTADIKQSLSPQPLLTDKKKRSTFNRRFFKKITIQRRPLSPNVIAAKLLLKNNLKKIKRSATALPMPWNKINTLLNSSNPRLFWEIIKLYSSSFNPILNSLNNKLLHTPDLFGKGSAAQLKILKNKRIQNNTSTAVSGATDLLSSLDLRPEASQTKISTSLPASLGAIKQREAVSTKSVTSAQSSATQGNVVPDKKEISIKALPSHRAELLLFLQQYSSNQRSSLFEGPASAGQNNLATQQSSMRSTAITSANTLASMAALSTKKKGGNSVSTALPYNFNVFNPQIKKKVLKFLQPDTLSEPVSGIVPLFMGDTALSRSKRTAIQSSVRANWLADNKRFLFLYFIVPIFFATLKNTKALPAIQQGHNLSAEGSMPLNHSNETSINIAQRRGWTVRQKNLNNQKKQLRSLVLLMLESGSVLRSQWRSQNARFIEAALDLLQTNVSLNGTLPYGTALKGNRAKLLDKSKDKGRKANLLNERYHLVANKNKLRINPTFNKTTKINETKENAQHHNLTKISQAEDIGYLLESLNFNILKTRAKSPNKSIDSVNGTALTAAQLTNSKVNTAQRSVESDLVAKSATDLLKWSVLFMAQSLAPLKRKHDYYSLIFIKILEARSDRGIIGLNKRAKSNYHSTPSIPEKGSVKNLAQIKSYLEALRVRDFSSATPHKTISAMARLMHSNIKKNKDSSAATSDKQDILSVSELPIGRKTASKGYKPSKAESTLVELSKAKASKGGASAEMRKKTLTEGGSQVLRKEEANQQKLTSARTPLEQKEKQAHSARSENQGPRNSQRSAKLNNLSKLKDIAPSLEEENKKASITFYPGGRYISDWKRVTKVIWQEDYKFNALYLRLMNSLSLANININKNLKNWYAIITIFRLWDIIKITSIKSVSSFKLQMLFFKCGVTTASALFFASIRRVVYLGMVSAAYKIFKLDTLQRRAATAKQFKNTVQVQTKTQSIGAGVFAPSGNTDHKSTLRTRLMSVSRLKLIKSKNKKQRQRIRRKLKKKTNLWILKIEARLTQLKQPLNIKKIAKKDVFLAMTKMPVWGKPNEILKVNISQVILFKKLQSMIIKYILNVLDKMPVTATLPYGTNSSSAVKPSLIAQRQTIKGKENSKDFSNFLLPVHIKATLLFMAKINGLDSNALYKLLADDEWESGVTYFKRKRPYARISRDLKTSDQKHLTPAQATKGQMAGDSSKKKKQNKATLRRKKRKAKAVKSLGFGQNPLSFKYFLATTYNKVLIWANLKKIVYIPTPTSLEYSLTLLVNIMYSRVPFIFSIQKLASYKKLNFISNDFSIPLRSNNVAALSKANGVSALIPASSDKQLKLYRSIIPHIQAERKKNVEEKTKKIIQQGLEAVSFSLNNEFKKSFNNLVNAKSTIIGKIRSIKLVELMDKIKENIIIAEQLAAKVRVTDITLLNLKNNKKMHRLKKRKFLNKKKIWRSNQIKILQTIKTIKTDFIFEPKLDSNALSNIPVSLLYYSNLIDPFGFNSAAKVMKPSAVLKLASGATSLAALNIHNLNTATLKKAPVLSTYLKELSIYNRKVKGIINSFSRIVGYNFNTNANKISNTIFDLLVASFKAMRCLISKPVFIITPEKITIQLFYFILVTNKKYIKKLKIRKRFSRNKRTRKIYNKKRLLEAKKFDLNSLIVLFPNQFNLLCGRLNTVFNKSVHFNLIRLHYPSNDTNILVNLMGIIINKFRKARIVKKVFKGSIIKSLTKKAHKNNNITIIPAFLTGLNIKVAGRLMNEKIKPRKTIYLARRGATASGKINYLNFARFTNKNKRGSFSITISAGQNYF